MRAADVRDLAAQVEITAASLEAARAAYAVFHRSRLIATNLQETKFNGANFWEATMEGTVIRYAIFPEAFFEGCQGCPHDW